MQYVTKSQKFLTALSPNTPPLSIDVDDHLMLLLNNLVRSRSRSDILDIYIIK